MQFNSLLRLSSAASLSCALLTAAPAAAADLYIPSQYANLQAALSAANTGDTIHIAAGTYTGTGWTDLVNPTGVVLDIVGDAGAYDTIIDLAGAGRWLRLNDAPGVHSIQGLTITNGERMGAGYQGVGGAILAYRSEIFVSHCRFSFNHSVVGAAIGLHPADATIVSCLFHDNDASEPEEGWGRGSAVYATMGGLEDDPVLVISQSTFAQNNNYAIYAENEDVTLEYSIVRENTYPSSGSSQSYFLSQAPVIEMNLFAPGDLALWGGYGSGNFSAFPKFVNSGANDFHIKSTSPARNMIPYTGPGSGWQPRTLFDIDADRRVEEWAGDLGADEFKVQPVPPQ